MRSIKWCCFQEEEWFWCKISWSGFEIICQKWSSHQSNSRASSAWSFSSSLRIVSGPLSFQGLRLLNTCQQGDMSFADEVLQVWLSPVYLGALSFKTWVEIVKKIQKHWNFVVMIPGFVWLNQFSSSLSSSRSRLKSSSLSCFKENRRHFAMMSDATETWAGNVNQMALLYVMMIHIIHWSLKGVKSPVFYTSCTGNMRRKGQLVVKVDDLLSQQTLNHQPDTRPVIMHLSLTWRRVRAANARNTQEKCHWALITKQPVSGVSQ